MRLKSNRRTFLVGACCLMAGARSATLLAQASTSLAPTIDPVEMEIIELGRHFLDSEPDTAAQLLKDVSIAAELAELRQLTWPMVHKARIFLTKPERIREELARADFFFVDGWLLARSEVGVALLFAMVYSQHRH